MKSCTKCLNQKDYSLFHKDKSKKDGFRNICKECATKQITAWQQTSEKYRDTYKEYYKKNKDKCLSWKNSNKDKVRATKAAYRSNRQQRQPTWLTKEQKEQILEFYTVAKEFESIFLRKQEVDHIVPLKGKTVSGLHVPWNLRIITAEENLTKRNKWDWELQQ